MRKKRMAHRILACLCGLSTASVFLGGNDWTAHAVDVNWMVPLQSESHQAFVKEPTSFSYLYYDQLDAVNQKVYETLQKDWETPTDQISSVVLPSAITYSCSKSMDNWTESDQADFFDVIINCCQDGKDALVFDEADIFWLNENGIMIGVDGVSEKYSYSSRTYTYTISRILIQPALNDAVEGSVEVATQMQNELKEAVANWDIQGETRYEKLKSIHSSLILGTVYDDTSIYMSGAEGPILKGVAVCEGYARATKLLCEREDIPCVLVFGNVDEANQTAHMWNDVFMDDGKWYGLDVTWDDLDNENNPMKYSYFLVGTDTFYQLHTETPEYCTTVFTYPLLASTRYTPGDYSEVVVTTTSAKPVTTTHTTTTTTSRWVFPGRNTTTTTKATTTTTKATTTTQATSTTVIPTATSTTTTSVSTTERFTDITLESTITTAETFSDVTADTTTETTSTTAETFSDVTANTTTETTSTTAETDTDVTADITTETTSTTAETFSDVTADITTETTITTEETLTDVTADTTTESTSTTTETTTAEPEPFMKGDANLDGSVTLADTIYMNRIIADLLIAESQSAINGDINSDGNVDAIDVMLMLKYFSCQISYEEMITAE